MTVQEPRAVPAFDVVVLAGGTGRRLGGVSKPDVVARGRRLLDHVLGGLEQLSTQPGGGPQRVVVVAPPSVVLPQGVLRALEDPPLGGPVAGVAAGVLALAGSRPPGEAGPGAGGRTEQEPEAAPEPTSQPRLVPATGPRAEPASQPVSGSAPKPVPEPMPQPAALTALLACDAPESWRALPVLAARLEAAAGSGQDLDGVVAVEPEADGGTHVQHLVGVYRTPALRALVAPGGVGLRDVSVHRTFARLRLGRTDLSQVPGLDRATQDLDTWDEVRRWERTGH